MSASGAVWRSRRRALSKAGWLRARRFRQNGGQAGNGRYRPFSGILSGKPVFPENASPMTRREPARLTGASPKQGGVADGGRRQGHRPANGWRPGKRWFESRAVRLLQARDVGKNRSPFQSRLTGFSAVVCLISLNTNELCILAMPLMRVSFSNTKRS
ncbi:hypothetical protein OFAG_00910 [Oxalobacter formigenes HOxBLS]|uniref:Uncharacterized protein n=1 Tax=Oxalobacter paraformigenes TaxID=556268 RepID=C3X3H1_9BURK|nr:hypothetical protein OFAG_00910 [Oxalobacter paraformigenes]